MDPLLLSHKFKFDFRAWMMLARTDPWAVYYRDGYARRTRSPFSPTTTNRDAHISNSFRTTAAAGKRDFSNYEHYWSMVDLQRYLIKNYEIDHPGKRLPPNYVRDILRPWVKQALRFIFLAAANANRGLRKLSPHYRKNGAVNIWAFDFVLDADLRPYVLEGNGGPSVSKDWVQTGAGGMPSDMHTTAIELAAKVNMERWRRDEPVLHHGGWELVYNEAGERCKGGGYDPCTIFKGQPRDIAAAWPYDAPDWPPPGAPFEVPTGKGNGEVKNWYGKDKEEIVRRTVGAGLGFREGV